MENNEIKNNVEQEQNNENGNKVVDITVAEETVGQKVWRWTKKVGGYVLAAAGGFLAHAALGMMNRDDNSDDDSNTESSEE